MGYANFTLAQVKADFQLTLEEKQNLFQEIFPTNPSSLLQTMLLEYIPLATAINTEKARSELLIAQILTEVRRQLQGRISLFSGCEFNVDSSQGLNGFCDYLICQSEEQLYITAPVLVVIEAKNEDIKGGLGQCIAEMIAAQIFNHDAKNDIAMIYGAVTTGTVWRFLTLENRVIKIDNTEYYINEVDKILGILIECVGRLSGAG